MASIWSRPQYFLIHHGVYIKSLPYYEEIGPSAIPSWFIHLWEDRKQSEYFAVSLHSHRDCQWPLLIFEQWDERKFNKPTMHLSHIPQCTIRAHFCSEWCMHRENSPPYSNHPRAHTVNLGRMTTPKIFPSPLATLPNLVLSHSSGYSDPIVLEPFDVTLW